jgi:hypothetical protein
LINWRTCLTRMVVATLLLGSASAMAQESSGLDGFSLGSKLFFDARTSGFSADGKTKMFKGEVVAIGSGVLITADEIYLDVERNELAANGHVLILTKSQMFSGDRVTFNAQNGDFRIQSALMITNDEAQVELSARRILGFTPKEMEFEAQRQDRLREIGTSKKQLRDDYRRFSSTTSEKKSDIVDRYALLLEQEELAKERENPALAKMSADRRKIFESRRQFWEAGRNKATPATSGVGYFRIEGKVLEKKNGNDYTADDAVWSPCKCDEDESPDWGFRAGRIDAQVGGYVNLYHPVLEIKGIPLLYLPYLKIPVKSERQSGFLMPTIAQDKVSGNLYSQPVYFVLGENQDATVTTDLIEKRGTKIGIEWRYKLRQYSGWSLQIESIRDRQWLNERANRSEIYEAKKVNCAEDLENAKARRRDDILNGTAQEELTSAEEDAVWEQCKQSNRAMESGFPVADNTWRFSRKWSGLVFLSERISASTNGSMFSDHRYVEDLTLVDRSADPLASGYQATFFVPAKVQLHDDGKDYYLGIGSAFSDHMRMSDRYTGLQIPGRLNLQSRMGRLLPGVFRNTPVYVQGGYDRWEIRDFTERDELRKNDPESRPISGGTWERAKLDFVSPIVVNSIIGVDWFADAEARYIVDQARSDDFSRIQSWRTGLTLKLPMIGEAEMPKWLRDSKNDEFGESVKGIVHEMDWAVTLSARPVVVRDGKYGEKFNGQARSYFVSDSPSLLAGGSDSDASGEVDGMIEHRRVIFETSQRWLTFARRWDLVPAQVKKDSTNGARQRQIEYLDRARNELLFSLDRNVTGADEMVDSGADSSTWFVNRYQYVTGDRSQFMDFGAAISYDFVFAERRLERERAGDKFETLPRPWSNPSISLGLNLFNSRLAAVGVYDYYLHFFREATFDLALPTIFSTTPSAQVKIRQDENALRDRERYLTLNSSLIPRIQLEGKVGYLDDQVSETETIEKFMSRVNVRYIAPSECWQLNFIREKDFDGDPAGKYVLQLDLIFMGQRRGLNDWSKAVLKNVPGYEGAG